MNYGDKERHVFAAKDLMNQVRDRQRPTTVRVYRND